MKNTILFSVFLALISIQVNAQNYGLGNTDPSLFTKYKIPDTDLHSLLFNTNFSFNSNKSATYFQDSRYVNNNSSNSKVNLTYMLNPQYYLLKESDNRVLSLRVETVGYYKYQREVNDGHYTTNIRNKTTNAQLGMHLTFDYNKYADASDLFYAFGSSAVVDLYDDMEDNSNNNYYSNHKYQDYVVSAGIGWGRMRNVNGIISAIRFQERLKQVNALNKDLDEKTIEDLAQKFSGGGYYWNVHDRPAKYIWQDIEKTLSNNGITLNGLNQYADSYIRETLSEITIIRNEGFKTSANINLKYNNSFHTVSTIDEQFYTLLNGNIAYSHQLNLNSQLSANLSLSGGPNVIANPDIRQYYIINAEIGYDYELTDRLFATIHNNFSLIFQNANIQGKNLSNDLSLVLNYFIEDNLSLGASYTWDYTDQKYINTFWDNEGNSHNVYLGFTYYIDRGLIFN